MVQIHDLTLRDGNHSINHKLTREDITSHCIFAEQAGFYAVEVGHGNGLGASSITFGESEVSDIDAIKIAKSHLMNTKLSVHIIPGIATFERDVYPAIELGVDIFRVATHCTEATVSKSYIEYIKKMGKTVFGALMMSATCTKETLLESALTMTSYGAESIIIMDSSGSFLPNEVSERVKLLVSSGVRVGFHGHNNLHMAVANSMAAIDAGAEIIDGTICGFGAGAGNTPLEIISVLIGLNTEVIMHHCKEFKYGIPVSTYINILTAKYKLFSGFDKHIVVACERYNIPIVDFVSSIANLGLVAGQEDMLMNVAATFHQNQVDG